MKRTLSSWRGAALAVAVVLGIGVALGVVVPASAATGTSITIDGTRTGRTFDGIGAVSGGGGNSRLLVDYPEPQRGQILDYLFKPGYGASLQLLKVEVGGDTNSTDGAEPSYQHTRGTTNCTAGYELWLAAQAKARNPAIKLVGLAWGAPGWVGNGSFWTQDMVDYYLGWLDCAKNSYGLTFDYLGGWNEKGDNKTFFLNLASALHSRYPTTEIIANDTNISFADTLAKDPTYAAAVDVIGTHYPCGWLKDSLQCPSSTNAINSGKPLWASEGGSQDVNTGNAALVRQINRGYLDGKYTAFLHWPLVNALYPTLPFATVGLVAAQQPWAGSYTVGKTAWTLAQYTQVIQPGWSFIDSAGGYLGGDRTNGSFISLRSPDRGAYSTVIETTTATAAQTASITVTGGLPTGPVHVRATNLASGAPSSQVFAKQADITPTGGKFSITLQPGWVYSLTTTTGQGVGTATGSPAKGLALPYADTFDGYPVNTQAKYLADMQGAFEVRPCAGGRSGRCVQQVAPIRPILWQGASDAFTLTGDPGWRDYTVSVDTLMEQAGTATLLGRVNRQDRPAGNEAHYALRVSNTGAWSVIRNTIGSCGLHDACSGTQTTLAGGTTTAPGLNSWHTMALNFNGSTITATLDGRTLGTAHDSAYTSGQVGFGVVGYQTNMWDNLSVTTTGSTPPAGGTGQVTSGLSGKCLTNAAAGTANGNPVTSDACTSGSAAQTWTYGGDRTLRDAGGKCLDVTAKGTANGALLESWDCNGGTNQLWQTGSGGSLVNPASGRCVDVPASSTTNGTQLEIWDCNGRPNQQWTLPS